MLTIASLILIAYLPGAIVFRFPVGNRAKRAALPADERMFWAVVISVVITTTTAFLLAAMSAYSLTIVVWCNAVLAGLLAAASLGNLRLGPTARKLDWTVALSVAIVTVGVWMYFAVPAAEYVLGGRDPGIYVNEGIQIAQRQSLSITDRVAAGVPASARDLFFPYSEDPTFYSLRFMGFQLRDPETGTVTGQFPQGYPMWIAIAYGLDGVTGTRRLMAWWAILGVLGVYFAARRLIGPVPAAAAAVLLSVHVIQTWYARYPNSEVVTQALIFPALLAHAYAHEDEDPFFGPIAASLLGLIFLTRLPAIVVLGPVVAASLLAHVDGHRTRAGFLAVLAGWLAVSVFYYLTQVRPYVDAPIFYLVHVMQPVHHAAIGVSALAVCALLYAVHQPGVAAATRTWLPRALIAAVAAGGMYTLYFREPTALLAPHDAHAVRMFADLYVTRVALWLAIVGYALVVWRSFWRAPALILGVTALSMLFLYKIRIWPEHFWLARRFLTEILPGTLIFASAALFAPMWMGSTWSDPRNFKGVRPLLSVIGMLGVIYLGQHYLSASKPIRTHIEYAGVIPEIERLAARFGDNDLVLVEARAASDLHTLALPLSYIWARNVLVLYSPRPDKPAFAEFLVWAKSHYQHVYFIGGGGTDLLSPGIHVEPVKTERFAVPEYEPTDYLQYPRRVRMVPFELTIYRFIDGGENDEGAFQIDVGAADDLNLVRFHAKERLEREGVTFRWTRERSYFSVPSIKANDRELVLRMSGGRPRQSAPARVNVFLADRPIGTAEPDGQFRDHVFVVPAALAAELAGTHRAAEVRIESTTWTPRDILGGTDDRALGVMVDRVEVR
jgi:dolichyl-phosphate-mannose-protein mannosyltransferase